MRTGLIAVLLAVAGLALATGCSPKQTEARADPRPAAALAGTGAPPSLETPEADLAAARARMPTRCVKTSCPALEARWTPEIAPCVLNAATREDAANCYGRAAWRLDRMLERQFQRAARTAEPAMARRVARLHADWRRGLAGCRLDVGQLGPESLVDENLCRLNFTIERQVALEGLGSHGRGKTAAP